jgi:hypothetical protein
MKIKYVVTEEHTYISSYHYDSSCLTDQGAGGPVDKGSVAGTNMIFKKRTYRAVATTTATGRWWRW